MLRRRVGVFNSIPRDPLSLVLAVGTRRAAASSTSSSMTGVPPSFHFGSKIKYIAF